jgi:hypothetical protein
MPDAKLTIVWDGAVPGLVDHRLSLSAFAPALRELLFAVRRVATDLEREARRRPVSGVGVGRNTKEASLLDVQIATIRANSPVTLECSIVPLAPPEYPLLEGLGDRAVVRLLEDIELETSGRPAHFKVRQFVRALPEGLELQRYTAALGSGEVKTVEVRQVRLADEPRDLPHLVEFTGMIAAIGFEDPYIRFRTSSGDVVACSGTREQIEEAVRHRDTEVTVFGVAGVDGRTRVLRLGTGHELPKPLPAAARLDRIISDWDPLLTILAK